MIDPPDQIRVYNLDTGREFTAWTSITVTEAFLSPCASFQLEAASSALAIDLARSLAADARVKICINTDTILSGYVDSCTVQASRSGGQSVSVQGRDILAPVVDGYVDPTMSVDKKTTLQDLLDLVLNKQFGLNVEFRDSNARRALQAKVSAPPSWNKSKHPRQTPLKEFKPRDNEGAFQYLSRVLTHHGYWLWCEPDGDAVVVAGPNYDQQPAHLLMRMVGSNAGANNILDASAKTDVTGLPSHLYVRGSDGSRGVKGKVLGVALNRFARRFKPAYLSDSNAVDKQTAERVAMMHFSRKLKDFFSYECTVQGVRAQQDTGLLHVDTVARVEDELLGISGRMWIESRSYTQSRSGTTTKLKLTPMNTLLLDYDGDAPSPAKYEVALSGIQPALAPVVSGEFTVDSVTFYKP